MYLTGFNRRTGRWAVYLERWDGKDRAHIQDHNDEDEAQASARRLNTLWAEMVARGSAPPPCEECGG